MVLLQRSERMKGQIIFYLLEQLEDFILRDVSVVIQIVHVEAEDDSVAEVTP